MPRAARNAGAGIDDARPLHLAREDRVAERQRGTVAVAEIAHGGEAGAQRLHPVRLGIERLRGGAERDFLELAGDAARVTCQMDMAVDETGERSEEHTSELQSLMRISYAVFCLKKKNNTNITTLHMF